MDDRIGELTRSEAIHPAPDAFTPEQLQIDPILQFFHFAHLPAALQNTSRPFCDLAGFLIGNLPRNAERTVTLRKLLEAKDAAVRANVAAGVSAGTAGTGAVASGGKGKPELDRDFPIVGEVQETGGADQDRDGDPPFRG